jgi:hypothetical protein
MADVIYLLPNSFLFTLPRKEVKGAEVFKVDLIRFQQEKGEPGKMRIW